MNFHIKRKDRSQILKTVQLCVFCKRSIKKGNLAILRKNKIFEHPECSKASDGYLGQDGVVERDRFGFPRCHLCGWYQEKLDLHIVKEHNMGVEEYRKFFSIPDNETLVAYTIESNGETPSVSVDEEDSKQVLIFSELKLDYGGGVGTRTSRQGSRSSNIKKQLNPLNKKPKRGRKKHW